MKHATKAVPRRCDSGILRSRCQQEPGIVTLEVLGSTGSHWIDTKGSQLVGDIVSFLPAPLETRTTMLILHARSSMQDVYRYGCLDEVSG